MLPPGRKVFVDMGEEWVEVQNVESVIFIREWIHVNAVGSAVRFHSNVVCSIAVGEMEPELEPERVLH